MSWTLDQMTGCSAEAKQLAISGNTTDPAAIAARARCVLHKRLFGVDKSISFTIGPIPAYVQFGGSGAFGLDGSVGLSFGSASTGVGAGCPEFAITTTFSPYVRVDFMAAFAVGNPHVFALGARVNLNLFQISVPISARLAFNTTNNQLDLNLTGSFQGSVLSGSIQLFARLFLWELTYTVIDWQGPRWDLPLFDYRYILNGADLQALDGQAF